MAEAILLTGKRGEGKSKSAARMMRDYLRQGRLVATNMDIRLDVMCGPISDAIAYRLPDYPSTDDLKLLPLGNPDPTNEQRNGLLVLDECAGFLNSRSWQQKDRQDFIAWLAQSRKAGWDLLFLAQHARMLDAQIRDSLFELHGVCRRTDKMAVPLASPLWQWLTGKALKFPLLHVVTFRYGFAPGAPKAMAWWYRGAEMHGCYDTLQTINPMTGQVGLSTYLSAWYLKGRRMTRFQLVRGAAVAAFVLGLMAGGAGGYYGHKWSAASSPALVPVNAVDGVKVVGTSAAGITRQVLFSDGRVAVAEAWKETKDGKAFRVDGRWYRSEVK